MFVAEIGDVHRFPGPAQLTCWAGLTPSHHESDTTVHRGRITKQGSRLVRWAAIESVKILPDTSHIGAIREQVAHRRGNRNIGAVAAARRQLELVFYGLRDHHPRRQGANASRCDGLRPPLTRGLGAPSGQAKGRSETARGIGRGPEMTNRSRGTDPRKRQ